MTPKELEVLSTMIDSKLNLFRADVTKQLNATKADVRSQLRSNKELFNEKFTGVHKRLSAEFTNVHDKLEAIEEQTTKTNGRVNDLEDVTHNLDKDAIKHTITCPQIKTISDLKGDVDTKLEKINSDLEEYRFFKKYPKIGVGIVAFACIAFLTGGFLMLQKLGLELKEGIKTELTNEIKDIVKQELLTN